MDLRDITLKYTRNTPFLLYNIDTVSISNVYLEGLSTKDVTVSYALFKFTVGHSMNIYNLTANNVTGPLFQTTDVLAHNFSTISLNNLYTVQREDFSGQYVLSFAKVKDFGKKGLNSAKPKDSYFDNFNLNGYTTIDDIDFTNNVNNSFFMIAYTNYGK